MTSPKRPAAPTAAPCLGAGAPPAPSVPQLVSASRRTDIPRYFGAWFAERRKAGYCESRSVFGRGYRVSLLREDVLGWLFWSKDTTPFEGELRALLEEGQAVAIQFTVNGYGPSVEQRIPGLDATVPAFVRASRMLPSPSAIQWRYDPLVVTEEFDAPWHRRNFRAVAASLEGATRVCNLSVVEPYPRAVRSLGEGAAYRRPEGGRHRQVLERRPDLRFAGEEVASLAADLAAIAREHGMELRSCCDPAARLPRAECCSAELFDAYGIAPRIRALPPGPTRPGCRCRKSVDIGVADTCPGGCAYCYVTRGDGPAPGSAAGPAAGAVRLR